MAVYALTVDLKWLYML